MKMHRLIFGSLQEPVLATIQVAEGFKNAYIAEAVFENTGEYLSETEVLQLEAQNVDRIFDACVEYDEDNAALDLEFRKEYTGIKSQNFTKRGM